MVLNRGNWVVLNRGNSAVDDRAGVIVDAVTTRGDVNEGNVIDKHVDNVSQRTGHMPAVVTADFGYAYAKVYTVLEQRGVEAIIPAKAKPKPTGVIPVRRFKASNTTGSTK